MWTLGCSDPTNPPVAAGASASSSSAMSNVPQAAQPAPVREGGALVRAASEDALYLAHEDLGVVWRIALPLTDKSARVPVKMPGPPAAVLALSDRILVTVRDPGMLVMLKPDAAKGLVETARVTLPNDAWGIAVTPDEGTALVTSAWTHQVSAVDIASAKKLWSVEVAREPRAVLVRPDGKSAYVTHLTSGSLTRLDGLPQKPDAKRVAFPAAPIRTLPERAEAATLAYGAVFSPDGARLFVPRQALGAFGKSAWNGQATVDILLTADETPLARPAEKSLMMWTKAFQKEATNFSGFARTEDITVTGPGPTQARPAFLQPRAIGYRKRTHTLLVASEGTNQLVELDALSIDPSTHALDAYKACGAPTGVALAEDEAAAYVFCRSTHELAYVPLSSHDGKASSKDKERIVRLTTDPLSAKAARGRQLFYDASDSQMSDGFACAGCHPEGRDDGHVWHEDESADDKGEVSTRTLHAFEMNVVSEGVLKGSPRQTPMLAGRVTATGSYGWKGRSPSLRHRVITGFNIHRWLGGWVDPPQAIERAEALVVFLREGLTPPPREKRALSKQEERGRELFNHADVGCASCHLPKTEYTNRAAVGLGEWPFDKRRYDQEAGDWRFKTPSLLYIAGTPPYYHDGSMPTLEALIETNGTRMGHTAQLSKDDRAALVAFLKTL